MRYFFSLFLSFFIVSPLSAQWQKLNDVDYTWGPFKIYNLSIFSETGDYTEGMRPLMLTFKYDKPVEGRDFAISIARSWANLDINPANKDVVIERLRKVMPNLKDGDNLYYIALPERGYFILNDKVISEEFSPEITNAILAVWLDPKVDIGHKLLKAWRKSSPDVEPFDPSVTKPETKDRIAAILDMVKDIEKIDIKAEIKPISVREPFVDGKYINPEIEVMPPFDNLLQVEYRG